MDRLGLDTVAIIGLGPSQANFRQETITQDRTESLADEIWCINAAAFGLRCDRVIWMDDLEVESRRNPYCAVDLNRIGKPVVTAKAHLHLCRTAIEYPIREAVELSLDLFNKPYLNNSVAYSIAYAMLGGVKQLKLYGCDFTYPDQGFAESGRACVESWILAFNWKHGGNVALAPMTSLFDTVEPWGLYGYETQPNIVTNAGEVIDFTGHRMMQLRKRVEMLTGAGIARNALEIEKTLAEIERIRNGAVQKLPS